MDSLLALRYPPNVINATEGLDITFWLKIARYLGLRANITLGALEVSQSYSPMIATGQYDVFEPRRGSIAVLWNRVQINIFRLCVNSRGL